MRQNKKFEKSVAELNANLVEQNKYLYRSVSIRYNILLAILRGIGYMLGATIIAGLLATLLVKTAKYIPFLEKIDTTYFEQKN